MGYIIAAGSFLVGVVLATGFAQMIRGGGILMFMAGTVNAALTMTGTLVFRSFALMWIDLVDSVIDRNARDKEY